MVRRFHYVGSCGAIEEVVNCYENRCEKHSSGLRQRLDCYFQPHRFQLLDQTLLLRLPMLAVEVVAAEFSVVRSAGQHVVSDEK